MKGELEVDPNSSYLPTATTYRWQRWKVFIMDIIMGSSSNVVGIMWSVSPPPLQKETATKSFRVCQASLPALLADHLGIGGGSGGFEQFHEL